MPFHIMAVSFHISGNDCNISVPVSFFLYQPPYFPCGIKNLFFCIRRRCYPDMICMFFIFPSIITEQMPFQKLKFRICPTVI